MTDKTANIALTPIQQKFILTLGGDGHQVGHQPHRGADSRAAVPVAAPLQRRGDRRHARRRALQRQHQPARTAGLGHRPRRPHPRRPPRSLREHEGRLGDVPRSSSTSGRSARPTRRWLCCARRRPTRRSPAPPTPTRASASADMLQFFELMTRWCEQTRKLPTPAVVRMVKMGDKLTRLLGMRTALAEVWATAAPGAAPPASHRRPRDAARLRHADLSNT